MSQTITPIYADGVLRPLVPLELENQTQVEPEVHPIKDAAPTQAANFEEYLIVATTAPILEVARQLVEQHPLKTYDATQLPSAMQARQTMPSGSPSIIFLSADNQLLSAATAEGFITDNSNRH